MVEAVSAAGLLSLMRWVSPTLPVGGYAYSRGLEKAVEAGWVHDEASALDWIRCLLEHSLGQLDAPVLVRVMRALASGDTAALHRWNDYLAASRESRELALEDAQMGKAFMRLLDSLDAEARPLLPADVPISYVTAFALACARSAVESGAAVLGFLWAAIEGQTSCAVRLVPLGQTAGQRILRALEQHVLEQAERAHLLPDDELGSALPALAMASALHETQYTRLFRS